jgi:hypothetical protein
MTDDNAKFIRALYLKGIMVGNTVNIELTQPLTGRNAEGEAYHVRKKGDIVEAELENDGWFIVIETEDFKIPLANGKVRK